MLGTGKTCKRCGTHYDDVAANFKPGKPGTTQGYHSPCKACRRDYQDRWKASDPNHQARQNAVRRERRKTDPQWAAEQNGTKADYYRRHRGERLAYARKYLRENRGAVNAGHIARYYADKARHRARAKDWASRNRERVRLIARNARARSRLIAGALATATVDQLLGRVEMFGGKCWMCGEPWREFDHVIPLAQGGPHIPANIRPACARCNRHKNNRRPSEMAS